jgi:2-polyprenyl-3-methyl-5-hydroxy-6-metoxy-1,4-benzoquinol methylase
MLHGADKVLEVGCADAFASRIVGQEVKSLLAVDFDPLFIENAKERSVEPYTMNYKVHDILQGPVDELFDAVYTLDVLEHIESDRENLFIENIIASLKENGTLIIGTPSLESQRYASAASKEGHINCKSQEELRQFLLRYFHNVFIFSMNDEVVHTGFHPMAHYLMALCCNIKIPKTR